MSQVQPVNTSWCLEKLCESHYRKLLQLIPELKQLQSDVWGWSDNRPGLHLKLIERSPYTLSLKLSHCFGDKLDTFMLPDVVIRVYFDAQLAEVLSDHARHPVFQVHKSASDSVAIMQYKWRLNIFLDKWLDHCLQDQYHFSDTPPETAPA